MKTIYRNELEEYLKRAIRVQETIKKESKNPEQYDLGYLAALQDILKTVRFAEIK